MDEDDEYKAYARRTDLSTSHDAAASVDVNKLERAVYNAIEACGDRGATWDGLHHITRIDKASISPRLKPLRKKGLIEIRYNTTTGKPIKRPGNSGKDQMVWFAVRKQT